MKPLITFFSFILGLSLFSQFDSLSYREVFDHDVNDFFRYIYNSPSPSQPPSYREVYILDKEVAQDSLSVTYIIHNDFVQVTLGNMELIENHNISIDTILRDYSLTSAYNLLNFNADTSYWLDSCGNPEIGFYYISGGFEPYYLNKRWAKGKGLTKHYEGDYTGVSIGNPQGVIYDMYLSSYWKEEWGCGNPTYLSTQILNKAEDPKIEISLHPNPTADFTTIRGLKNESHFYSIYDTSGKIVAENNLDGPTISLQNLDNGIYLLFIQNKNNEVVFTTRVVKE